MAGGVAHLLLRAVCRARSASTTNRTFAGLALVKATKSLLFGGTHAVPSRLAPRSCPTTNAGARDCPGQHIWDAAWSLTLKEASPLPLDVGNPARIAALLPSLPGENGARFPSQRASLVESVLHESSGLLEQLPKGEQGQADSNHGRPWQLA